MFERGQEVVRKSISNGVKKGNIIRATEDIALVAWHNGKVTSIHTKTIMLATPENVNNLELKRLK